PKRQRRVAIVAAVTVLVVLIAGLLFGKWVLDLLGIDLAAFRIAGAAVIIALAWSLITSHPSPFTAGGAGDRPISVVPIGFPSLAGPGALTLVISYSTLADSVGDYGRGVAVIGLVAGTAAIVLICAPVISRALTPVGLDVFSRIFGILLLAIAIGTLL